MSLSQELDEVFDELLIDSDKEVVVDDVEDPVQVVEHLQSTSKQSTFFSYPYNTLYQYQTRYIISMILFCTRRNGGGFWPKPFGFFFSF